MSELKFASDTRQRKGWFTGVSFSHPAKMSLPLQLWLIENYSKPGETILDPMAGSGTVLVACSMGRNVIAVELEQKFIDIMMGNWEKIKQRGAMMGYQFGQAQILQGDARNLEGLLVDKVIASPPYSEGLGHQHRQYGRDIESSKSIQAPEYSRNPDNIGNLPYGQVDKCIFSPPFKEQMQDTKWMQENQPRKHRGTHNPQSQASNNIGNLPYGQVDKIVTSPPYEGSLDAHHGHSKADRVKEFEKLRAMGYKINPDSADNKVRGADYSESSTNIGNLKSTSYLEAMLTVYKQCFRVLRPGGLMILVTKNFIRDQKEVRLDSDTIALAEKAGFKFVERHYRKLTAQSFWRTIYASKYPSAPKLDKEDILVFSKQGIMEM